MDKVWKMLALVGLGYVSWMVYKKMNPECAHDALVEVEKLTKKMKDAGKSVENMM